MALTCSSPVTTVHEVCIHSPRATNNSRTPLIRTLVIQIANIANYPDRLGPSGKHFRAVTVLHFLSVKFFPICQKRARNCVLMFYLNVKKIFSLQQPSVETFATSNCQCSPFSKKNPIIQISAYPDGSSSQWCQRSGVLLYISPLLKRCKGLYAVGTRQVFLTNADGDRRKPHPFKG